MSCEEKARLIEDHSRKALAYARATRTLNGKRGTSTATEYAQLKAVAQKTMAESKEARRLVQEHVSQHGC